MGSIDFLLNLAGLLLWVSWRSLRFDPLVRSTPVTLVGTLKRAEPRRLHGGQLALILPGLVLLRAVLYWIIGSPANWTPKINLELVVLAFRGDNFLQVLVFSCLSFIRTLVVFHFWLIVLSVINGRNRDPDPIQKLVRLQLGRIAKLSWLFQLLVSLLMATALWLVFQPLLARIGVVVHVRSSQHLIEQGLLVALGLILSLKYLLPAILLLHLVSSYVYLGTNPFWDFLANTSANVTGPLRRLPLRLSKLDLAPVLGVILILCALEWLPNFLLSKLAAANLTAWPL